MSHRVRAFVCGAIALAAMAMASQASADRPVKNANPPAPTDSFPANTICAFPISIENTSRTAFTITHLDNAGQPLWTFVGGQLTQTITNDLTGESITLNASGPGKITSSGDGLTITASGPWILGFFPTDSPAMSLLYLTGRTVFTVDPATGRQVLVSHEGTVLDICAELSA